MRNFLELVKDCLTDVREIMPWDMAARVAANPDLLIIDVREPYEFDAMHIEGSIKRKPLSGAGSPLRQHPGGVGLADEFRG